MRDIPIAKVVLDSFHHRGALSPLKVHHTRSIDLPEIRFFS